MIGHYLSSNNEICYSTKTNNFSPTKQGLLHDVLVGGPVLLFELVPGHISYGPGIRSKVCLSPKAIYGPFPFF